MCIKTLVGHVMCLKMLKTVPFERSEPFHLLRMMGVSVPSLHIESTDSMMNNWQSVETYVVNVAYYIFCDLIIKFMVHDCIYL